MSGTGFDRVRPRVGAQEPGRRHDAEGKRALFSSTDTTAPARPNIGTVTVECSRCDEATVMSPVAAARTALPSLLLSVGVGRGERESTLGLSRRRYGAFLRCPACGRGAWTRLTLHL